MAMARVGRALYRALTGFQEHTLGRREKMRAERGPGRIDVPGAGPSNRTCTADYQERFNVFEAVQEDWKAGLEASSSGLRSATERAAGEGTKATGHRLA